MTRPPLPRRCTGWSRCSADEDLLMPAIDRGLDTLSFLTDDAREALRRRLRQLGGLGLIGLALLLAVALASWSVQDPSLSHATTTRVRNLLGYPGAIVADLLMQLLGLAAIALVLPIAIWGWRLAAQRQLHRERIRLLLWMVGLVSAACLASCLPRTPGWPLPAGMGGVIGDGILRHLLAFAGGPQSNLGRIAIGLLMAFA